MLFKAGKLAGSKVLLLLIAGIAMLAVLALTQKLLYQTLLEKTVEQTSQEAFFLKTLLDESPELQQSQTLFKKAKELGTRLTLVLPDGRVANDSAHTPQEAEALENHKDRLEIILAKEHGYGTAVRFSGTMQAQAVYVAVQLENGSLLRLALPLTAVKLAVQEHFTILLALTGTVALAIVFAFYWQARQLHRDLRRLGRGVNAIAQGNYGHTVSNLGREEFIPLAESINIVARDIQKNLTSLTDKNSQLSTILETVEAGIAVLGARGTLRSWNKSFADMCHAGSLMAGRQMIEVLPVPALQKSIEEQLAAQNTQTKTLRVETTDKRQLFIHICKPEKISEKLTLVVIINDITTIMLLEKIQRDFVANVSHELRTPLTAIKGFAETLTGSQCTLEECRHFGSKILKHGTFLADTVEDLLLLARVEDTAKNLNLEQTDPLACANMARQIVLGKNMSEGNIEIEQTAACCQVMANKILLVQAMRNLMENACRYSPAGSAVTVCITKQDNHCLIAVSDNGTGIPKAEQERIFERFYRVEKMRNSGTTGLGLAITKEIIERFSGKIWVESPAKTATTTFYISLPCI